VSGRRRTPGPLRLVPAAGRDPGEAGAAPADPRPRHEHPAGGAALAGARLPAAAEVQLAADPGYRPAAGMLRGPVASGGPTRATRSARSRRLRAGTDRGLPDPPGGNRGQRDRGRVGRSRGHCRHRLGHTRRPRTDPRARTDPPGRNPPPTRTDRTRHKGRYGRMAAARTGHPSLECWPGQAGPTNPCPGRPGRRGRRGHSTSSAAWWCRASLPHRTTQPKTTTRIPADQTSPADQAHQRRPGYRRHRAHLADRAIPARPAGLTHQTDPANQPRPAGLGHPATRADRVNRTGPAIQADPVTQADLPRQARSADRTGPANPPHVADQTAPPERADLLDRADWAGTQHLADRAGWRGADPARPTEVGSADPGPGGPGSADPDPGPDSAGPDSADPDSADPGSRGPAGLVDRRLPAGLEGLRLTGLRRRAGLRGLAVRAEPARQNRAAGRDRRPRVAARTEPTSREYQVHQEHREQPADEARPHPKNSREWARQAGPAPVHPVGSADPVAAAPRAAPARRGRYPGAR
jgi:hypothetical protein